MQWHAAFKSCTIPLLLPLSSTHHYNGNSKNIEPSADQELKWRKFQLKDKMIQKLNYYNNSNKCDIYFSPFDTAAVLMIHAVNLPYVFY